MRRGEAEGEARRQRRAGRDAALAVMWRAGGGGELAAVESGGVRPAAKTERMTGFRISRRHRDTQKWSLLGVVETARDLNSFFQRSVVPPAPSYCVSRSAGGYNIGTHLT